jgi:MoaA/NifB/PqqE/SkfB family radical SAM enzyme|tara:strand:+ start:126 stop:1184 length:1059 start_codon:yes stop_codon:yes gene_type:complete
MGQLSKKAMGGLKVASRKLFGRQAPLEINIHITDKCNLKCTYCYSNFYRRHNDDISKDNIFKIVDAFQEMGVIEVSLIGGEPFLHPHFSQIVNYVKSKSLFCSAVTNGYFIQRHIETAKRLDMVCISIDGPEVINDITRGKGSYKRAVDGLRLLREHNINRSIRSTLQKHNLEYIEEMMDLAVEYDAILNFGLLFPQSSEDGHVKTISTETPDDIVYRKALRKIIELKKQHPERFFNSITNFNNALNWPTSYTRFFLFKDELGEYPDFRPVPCCGGRTFATVDTDGRLYPCTNLIGYYDAPNVLEMDIKEAWYSIGDHTCSACFYLSSVEKNLVSNLNINALWNLVRVKRLK